MNFARSAIAPETMVAAVAQNTVWKIRYAGRNGTVVTSYKKDQKPPIKGTAGLQT